MQRDEAGCWVPPPRGAGGTVVILGGPHVWWDTGRWKTSPDFPFLALICIRRRAPEELLAPGRGGSSSCCRLGSESL